MPRRIKSLPQSRKTNLTSDSNLVMKSTQPFWEDYKSTPEPNSWTAHSDPESKSSKQNWEELLDLISSCNPHIFEFIPLVLELCALITICKNDCFLYVYLILSYNLPIKNQNIQRISFKM